MIIYLGNKIVVKLKRIIRKVLGERYSSLIKNTYLLFSNFLYDAYLYFIHSSVFFINNDRKLECHIILDYHSIEKGLLFKEIKPQFAKDRVVRLRNNIEKYFSYYKEPSEQVVVALKVMCKYYEVQSDTFNEELAFFPKYVYEDYKAALGEKYDSNFSATKKIKKSEFYSEIESEFKVFSSTRKSVRSFSSEVVPIKEIEKAVSLAMNAPSVCNRQGVKVYYIDNKEQIDKALEIQAGMRGYVEDIKQLLIITVDRNYFYTIGERNQMYIDGGIFLMNLLYSLHYYRIGSCPANWGKNKHDELMLSDCISFPKNEKIICMLPVGYIGDEVRVTLSKRREIKEVFHLL